MTKARYGSGTGNSYQSDWQKCRRYFFEKHRLGLTRTGAEQIVALAVGTAGHLWYEVFYTTVLDGQAYDACVAAANRAFWEGTHAEHEAAQLGDLMSWDTLMEDEKMNLALLILKARSRDAFERQESGQERTISLEENLSLDLPTTFSIPATGDRVYVIHHTCGRLLVDADTECIPDTECLKRYTIKCDRIFEDAKDGVLIEDHKFTSANSPKQYANEMLNNDQSTRYVYVWNELDTSSALDGNGSRGFARGVRYNVNRLHKSITASSFHEEVRVINDNQLIDSWMRLCLERAEMSRLWNEPRELWQADRWSSGPCIRFGRACEFLQLCDDPGREGEYIGARGSNKTYWLPEAPEATGGTASASTGLMDAAINGPGHELE